LNLSDGLTLTATQEKHLEAAVTVISAVAAWEFQATEKYDHGVSLISKQRFGDAIAQTFGQNVAKQLFPNTNIQGVGPTINPSGVVNSVMGTGIALLIADKVAEEFFGSTYTKMDGLPPVVRGPGKGLTVGGIFGGLVDPTYGTATPGPAYMSNVVRGADLGGSGVRVNQLNR